MRQPPRFVGRVFARTDGDRLSLNEDEHWDHPIAASRPCRARRGLARAGDPERYEAQVVDDRLLVVIESKKSPGEPFVGVGDGQTGPMVAVLEPAIVGQPSRPPTTSGSADCGSRDSRRAAGLPHVIAAGRLASHEW